MYFKLKEPILYNYFLNKEIYRLTIYLPFDMPIVIRIENDGRKIELISKKLNKNFWYPFHTYGRDWKEQHDIPTDVAILNADGDLVRVLNEKAYKELLRANKLYDDSLSRIYNDPDNKTFTTEITYLDKPVWDSITYFVKKSDFWTSRYNSFLNYCDPDASLWVLEGHSKFGYQCIRIYSPFASEFGSGHDNESELDKLSQQNKIKLRYARLLRYIITKTKMRNEKLN
jgi:hypothetical protein